MYRSSLYILGFLIGAMVFSCSKSDVTDNPNALLSNNLPNDSLSFDTIFTSQGSITRKIMLYNLNDKKLRFSVIKLAGGDQSPYQLNVSGRSGTNFSDIELDGGDSLYIFVRVNINPNDASSPFLVRDSIQLLYNGKTKYLQLQAFGQNAYYIHQTSINNDTAWTNTLPIVLLQKLTIPAGKKLSIQKGARIYVHGISGLQVDGQLQALGDTAKKDRISFLTDRLDYDYKDLAGAWQGITFGNASIGNVLRNVTIQNATNALVDTSNTAIVNTNKLTVSGAIIQNNAGYGLLGRRSNWFINNSLIANNGQDLGLYDGGSYQFVFNTIVGYSNSQVSHNQSNVYLSGNASAWNVNFTNNIIYGNNNSITDEVTFDNSFSWTNAHFSFTNCLIKYNSLPSQITLTNTIANQDPAFRMIDNDKPSYDFRLLSNSPAISKGISGSGIAYDLLGQVRNSLNPSIGCYENQ